MQLLLDMGILLMVIAIVGGAFYYCYKYNLKYGYTCKHCGQRFSISFGKFLFVLHIFSWRYTKCTKCGIRSFNERYNKQDFNG